MNDAMTLSLSLSLSLSPFSTAAAFRLISGLLSYMHIIIYSGIFYFAMLTSVKININLCHNLLCILI